MGELPELFTRRMKMILGDEWELFLRESEQSRQYGLRVNTLKISAEEFERIAPFHLKRIPWIPNGFYYEREDEPARHPFYAAGLYYLQEPSAMTPASRLIVEPGDRVLDLCAAPGGKATELATGLKGMGLIVANDINQARARALLRNMELFGVSNSFITNEPPHILADRFPEGFDKIMVDAPCSGEGMFRKNPAVMESWKEKGPEYFSVLQRDIILHAADMLKPGGRMFYSTCTFAPEENEGVITHLLGQRPEMELIPMEDYEGFSPGVLSFDGQDFHESCVLCRRIWPHRMAGEGHFMALLRKKTEDDQDYLGKNKDAWEETSVKNHRGKKKGRNKLSQSADQGGQEVLADFFRHVRGLRFAGDISQSDHMDIRGDKVYYVPDHGLADKNLHFLRNGVYLGDLKKKRFEPSQPFALALSKEEYDRTIDLPAGDERIHAYLAGESIRLDDQAGFLQNGWHLLMADGYPLGWGKLSGTTLKNKYPPGWRRR